MVTLTILCYLVALLLCAAAVLLPFLGIALQTVAVVLLCVNIALLLVILVARRKWGATGRMEKAYINSVQGIKRGGLLLAKYGSLVLIIWQVLCIAAAAAALYFINVNAAFFFS